MKNIFWLADSALP